MSASQDLVADRQLQLFQPFHLWHTLPGFSFAAFCRRDQKAASLTRASLLNVFFTCFTSPPLKAVIVIWEAFFQKGLLPQFTSQEEKVNLIVYSWKFCKDSRTESEMGAAARITVTRCGTMPAVRLSPRVCL